MQSEIAHVEPHGGRLTNLLVDAERAALLKEISLDLPDLTLNDRQLCDLELLATGAFSPLEGFLKRTDYESVLDRMRLQNETLWPIPICLDVNDIQVRNLEGGQSAALRDPEGFLLAIMHVADMWSVEREKEAQSVYGFVDAEHQGISYLFNKIQDVYIGGQLEVLSLPLHFDFKQIRRTPRETRSQFKKLSWQRVAAFQTRSPIQRPQFEMTINAMRDTNANLLLLPIVGRLSRSSAAPATRQRDRRRPIPPSRRPGVRPAPHSRL